MKENVETSSPLFIVSLFLLVLMRSVEAYSSDSLISDVCKKVTRYTEFLDVDLPKINIKEDVSLSPFNTAGSGLKDLKTNPSDPEGWVNVDQTLRKLSQDKTVASSTLFAANVLLVRGLCLSRETKRLLKRKDALWDAFYDIRLEIDRSSWNMIHEVALRDRSGGFLYQKSDDKLLENLRRWLEGFQVLSDQIKGNITEARQLKKSTQRNMFLGIGLTVASGVLTYNAVAPFAAKAFTAATVISAVSTVVSKLTLDEIEECLGSLNQLEEKATKLHTDLDHCYATLLKHKYQV